MKRLLLVVPIAALVVAAVVAVAPARDGGSKSLRGSLDGLQESPPNSTTGRGDIKVRISADSIDYTLRYGNLEEPVVLRFAHIHFGQRNVNGGVAAFLCGGGGKPACPESGTVSGTIDAGDVEGPADQGIDPGEFDELVRVMRKGFTYANVHTDNFPGGEIRGQIGDADDDDHEEDDD